jgi:L-iditol 2-dehydrogenase
VRIAYAGICGSDLPRFAVTGSYFHPMVLGHECSGTVDTPSGSGRLKKGDRVAILPIIPCGVCEGCRNYGPFHCTHYQFIGSRNDGGFAEYCAVPDNNLFPLPDSLSLKAGALIEPALVGLHVVRQSGFRAGQDAIVFGAGPIGLMVASWLRVLGARRVVLSDLRAFSRDLAHKAGFDDVIDPAMEEPAASGFDMAYEAAGSGKALQAAIGAVRSLGTITVVGRDTRDTVIPIKSFETMMRKEIALRGCWGYNLQGDEALLYDTLEKGLLPMEALVTHEVGLQDSPAMVAAMLDKKMDYGKVLIKMAE